MVILLGIISDFAGQTLYYKFYLLFTTQQFPLATFQLSFASLTKVVKLTMNLCLRICILIVKLLVIFDKGYVIVSLDAIKPTTFINNLHSFIFFLVFLDILIDSASGRYISKLQLALNRIKSLESSLIFVEASQISQKCQIRKLIGYSKVNQIRNDSIGDEEVQSQLRKHRQRRKYDDCQHRTIQVHIEQNVPLTYGFLRVCKRHVLGYDWNLFHVNLLFVILLQNFIRLKYEGFIMYYFYGHITLVNLTHLYFLFQVFIKALQKRQIQNV